MTRAEINRIVRAVMDTVPNGRLAKHATPEERLVLVARVVDALRPVLGKEARQARAPAWGYAGLAKSPPVRVPGRRRAPGVTGRRAPGALVKDVEKRLRAWLPAGVERLDDAASWADERRTKGSFDER